MDLSHPRGNGLHADRCVALVPSKPTVRESDPQSNGEHVDLWSKYSCELVSNAREAGNSRDK